MSVIILICLVIVIGIAMFYNVPKAVSGRDVAAIEKILEQGGYSVADLSRNAGFEGEVAAILAVQDAVFKASPAIAMIALKQRREPENLLASGAGYCGDRARTMAKALMYLGFQTRHASLYRRMPGHGFFHTFFLKTAKDEKYHSHALIEVKTQKGWMAVDTRSRWMALTPEGTPLSLKGLQKRGDVMAGPWSDISAEKPFAFFEQPFYVVYGLYSRHGLFYPPFIKYLPNVNWGELTANMTAR